MRFVLCALFASALMAQTTARGWINQGVEAFKEARFADAVTAFQNAVDRDPGNVSAHLYLGTAYMQQFIPGATDAENLAFAQRAESEFQAVLTIAPDNGVAVLSLANLEMNQRHWEEARRWFERSITIDPKNAGTYYSLAFIDWSRWYPAYGAARSALGMRPPDPGPISEPTRGRLRDEWLPTLEDGISNLNKALEINPQYADAMAYMNLLVREKADLADSPEEYRRQIAEADQWMRKAMEINKEREQSAPPPPPPQADGVAGSIPPRIHIGGLVQAAKLVTKVEPVYPPLAQQARITGTVRLSATIDREGKVIDLKVISGHPLLVQAALDAVRHWVYRPTLLNGEPVEVSTTIDVPFVLPQ